MGQLKGLMSATEKARQIAQSDNKILTRPVMQSMKLHRAGYETISTARKMARRHVAKTGTANRLRISKRIDSMLRQLRGLQEQHPGLVEASYTTTNQAETGRHYELSRQRIHQIRELIHDYLTLTKGDWKDLIAAIR